MLSPLVVGFLVDFIIDLRLLWLRVGQVTCAGRDVRDVRDGRRGQK